MTTCSPDYSPGNNPQTRMAAHGGVLKMDVIGATFQSKPLFRCPLCKKTGTIDDDQFRGRVSVICAHAPCSYHETKDWSITA